MKPIHSRLSITALAILLAFPAVARAGEPGNLTREVWTAVPGGAVSDLTQLPRFHGGPDAVALVSGSAAPSNAGDNYGSRLRGFLTAPVTGDYSFWESGDDAVELWMAQTPDKFAAALTASHTGWTSPLQWDKYPTQRSATMRLAAGQKCYIELRHKEGGGADHAALAWAYDEIQPGINLARLPGVTATQSTTYPGGEAINAIDGNTGGITANGDKISHTNSVPGAWWQVDLGTSRSVDRLVLWNRGTWRNRLANFRVCLLDEAAGVMLARDFHTDGTYVGEKLEWSLPGAINARFVTVEKIGPDANGTHFICLAEAEVFGAETPQPVVNLARLPGVTATQSATYPGGDAINAIDGNTGGVTANGDKISHTTNNSAAWWQVDLGSERTVESLVLWNRSTWWPRLANFRVRLLDEAGGVTASQDFFTNGTHAGAEVEWDIPGAVRARTIRVEKIAPDIYGTSFICLAEVEVFGASDRLAHVTRRLVDAAALESYTPDPLDLDDDDLLDAWELAHGFDTATWQDGDHAYGVDPDRDYLANFTESRLGYDPFQPDRLPGHFTLEQWTDVPYYTIPEAAVGSDRIYQQPDYAYLVPGANTGEHQMWFTAQRLRGYITAPETGAYRFWLSATNGARLLISSADDKFHKRVVAAVGPDIGTGHGPNFYQTNKWDLFVSQMSAEITLVAGHTYFVEVVHQHGHGHYPHAGIVWARPNADREEIPGEYLSSYHPVAGDDDDDSLPDAWETDHGLSATDNGLTDRARQGEHGDFDGDGLTNHAEYLLGTRPDAADSDGDGLSDRDEHEVYGTNPSVSDATPELLVATVAPATVAGLGEGWTATAAGAMTASFRGRGTWSFTVPEDGFWVLQVEAAVRGNSGSEEIIPVEATVDGAGIARTRITFLNRQPGSLRVFSPWLKAGSHALELFIDNRSARVSVEITAIKVLRPGGLDSNGDGRPDAVLRQLAAANGVSVHAAAASFVSPVFIEGIARSPESIELRTAHDGPSSTIRHKDSFWAKEIARIQSAADLLAATLTATPDADRAPAGAPLSTLPGAGHESWFARVPLLPNQATRYTSFFENGALADAGVVVWRPLNLIGTTEITIPAGSDLLMGAWENETDNCKLEFAIGAETRELRAQEALSWHFDQPGDHAVTAVHHGTGETLTLTVHVRAAALPDDLAAAELRYNQVTLPAVAPDLAFDTAGCVGFDHFLPAVTGTGTTVRLMGLAPGIHRAAARMADFGPVLDVAPVTVVGVSDALRNLSDTATAIGNNLYHVRSPLLVTDLPAGGTVKISIFAGGVTFLDGTTVKTFTAADFDENGLLILEFLMPSERVGAPCHYLEIFDASGRKIHGP